MAREETYEHDYYREKAGLERRTKILEDLLGNPLVSMLKGIHLLAEEAKRNLNFDAQQIQLLEMRQVLESAERRVAEAEAAKQAAEDLLIRKEYELDSAVKMAGNFQNRLEMSEQAFKTQLEATQKQMQVLSNGRAGLIKERDEAVQQAREADDRIAEARDACNQKVDEKDRELNQLRGEIVQLRKLLEMGSKVEKKEEKG